MDRVVIGYKGYDIIQSEENNNICVFKDNKIIYHINTKEKKTKLELKKTMDRILELFEEQERGVKKWKK